MAFKDIRSFMNLLEKRRISQVTAEVDAELEIQKLQIEFQNSTDLHCYLKM